MKRTTRATAVLLAATIAAVGCSKKDSASPARTAAPLSTQTSSDFPQAPKGFGEDDVVAVATKIDGPVTFTDGEAAFQSKKYADATSIFERYVAQKPKNVWGHYMLGLSAWKNGDAAKA